MPRIFRRSPLARRVGYQYLYVTEMLSLMTVLTGIDKVYVEEGGAYRVITLPPAVYDGAGLATALQTALNTGSSG